MNPMTIGVLVFAFTFGGALAGIWLHAVLPPHHLDSDSQATMKLGIGLIATMTALVLGIVTASAKSSFDALDTAVKQSAADVLTLDRTLARFGSDTRTARIALHDAVAVARKSGWRAATVSAPGPHTAPAPGGAERVMKHIRALPEQNDDQRWLKTRAVDLGEQLLESRWVAQSSVGSSVPVPFLIVLVFWLVVIFISFGLYAPRNGTVISILLVCALSVASAVFLILEMDGPFAGVIHVSPAPLDFALAQMNQ